VLRNATNLPEARSNLLLVKRHAYGGKLYKLYRYIRQEGYVMPGVCLFVYV